MMVAPWLTRDPGVNSMLSSSRRSIFAALLIAGLLPQYAQAWGDQGRRITALIAERYLDPVARTQLDALLGGRYGQPHPARYRQRVDVGR
jgi:hypothetical protein